MNNYNLSKDVNSIFADCINEIEQLVDMINDKNKEIDKLQDEIDDLKYQLKKETNE